MMSFDDNLEIILGNSDGDTVSQAIVDCLTELVSVKYPNADVSDDIAGIMTNCYGREIKKDIYDVLVALSQESFYGGSYIYETSLDHYNSINHTDMLYGIIESDMAYVLELDSNYKPIGVSYAFSTSRDIQTFLSEHREGHYHVYVGANMSTSLLPSLFSYETGLYSITIPSTIITIPDTLFYYSGLTRIYLPDTLLEIESGAFSNCSNLSEINLPHSITTISGDAFLGCNGIIININKAENSIEDAPWGATNATINWTGL